MSDKPFGSLEGTASGDALGKCVRVRGILRGARVKLPQARGVSEYFLVWGVPADSTRHDEITEKGDDPLGIAQTWDRIGDTNGS